MDKRGTLLVPVVVTLTAAAMSLDSNPKKSGKVIKGNFPGQEQDRCAVFVSFYPDDERYWGELDPFLADLRDNNVIIYSYKMVEPGGKIREAAQSALKYSSVVVLILSQPYVASDLMKKELPGLLERVEEDGALMLTVHAGAHDAKAKSLQKINNYKRVGLQYKKPLNDLTRAKRESVYLELLNAIRDRLKAVGRYPT